MNQFVWISTRNCRKFYKRVYTLNKKIDQDLIRSLSDFGLLEDYSFSNFSQDSKDIFKVKMDDEIEISGTIDDTYLQVTVTKKNPEILMQIEAKINSWSEVK